MYFIIDRNFGLLSTKTEALLNNTFWNIGFYGHIIPGGLALFIGWTQFSNSLRTKYPSTHQAIGKIYIISVIISGLCGLAIAQVATGGLVSILGFSSLAIIWLSTTVLAFKAIKKRQIELHQKLMIFSYAACFAAVTLRIWLPLLTNLFGSFYKAYPIVAWISWVPNIMIAQLLVNRLKKQES